MSELLPFRQEGDNSGQTYSAPPAGWASAMSDGRTGVSYGHLRLTMAPKTGSRTAAWSRSG
jgi:hypothetical protein